MGVGVGGAEEERSMGWGGGEGDYIPGYRYTDTTRMIPALRWAAMRDTDFNVSLIVKDKVIRQCPQTTTSLKRKESRSGFEPRSLCLPAQRLTAGPQRLTELCVCVHSLMCPISSTSRGR